MPSPSGMCYEAKNALSGLTWNLLQQFLIHVAELHEFPQNQSSQIHTLLREVNFTQGSPHLLSIWALTG